MKKYFAVIQIGENLYPVFPRSMKRTWFLTIKQAEKALEDRGKRLILNTRGFIYEGTKEVLTIAL